MLVDTHCHISMLINKDDDTALTHNDYQAVETLLRESAEHDVTHIITISTTIDSVYHSIAYAQQYKQVSAVLGLHPCDYGTNWQDEIQRIDTLLMDDNNKQHVVAIGECGLDFHHPGYDADEQRAIFQAQIELALKHNLPIVVHSRKATQEALDVIETYRQDGIRGVIHCYGGDADLAIDIRDRFGFYIGIGGPVTYPKNNTLRDAVQAVGIDNILLETDAPFLPPQVIRGKRNHPLYVETIAHRISDVVQLPLQTVADRTTANARDLFAIAG